MTTASTLSFSDSTPTAPSGQQNIVPANDGGSPTVNVSFSDPPMVGDTGSGGTGGNVPAPASGDAAAGKFLKADGTWAVPSGGGSGLNQLTGDVTAGPGTGSQAATLATVNASPGSFTNANITVNAKGLVTASSNGSGGGGGGLTLIATQTLSAPSGDVSFTAIPGTYTHLKLVIEAASSNSGGSDERVAIQFNGDSGANYDWCINDGGNSWDGHGNAASEAYFGVVPSQLAAAYVSAMELDIPFYSLTALYKSLVCKFAFFSASDTRVETGVGGGQWRSTAAITQIDVITVVDSFLAGSSFSLYGY